jgi:hypothetical protein
MLSEEFNNLLDFTELEIGRTGADFTGVSFALMLSFQLLRTNLGRRVKFHKNGLTTGKHKSKYHPAGLAGDFYLDPDDGKVDPKEVYLNMVLAGFKGIGVYLNRDGSYSFHGDLRVEFGDWFLDRRVPGNNYTSIFISGMLSR